jgi:hypothetical protein
LIHIDACCISKLKDDLKEMPSSASQRQCGKIAGGHRVRYPSSNQQQLEHGLEGIEGIEGIDGIDVMAMHASVFLEVSAPCSCQMSEL